MKDGYETVAISYFISRRRHHSSSRALFPQNRWRIHQGRILNFDQGLSPVGVFDQEIRAIVAFAAIRVYPGNGYAMPFLPLGHFDVIFQTSHHHPFKIAIVTFEVVRALAWVFIYAPLANRHISPSPPPVPGHALYLILHFGKHSQSSLQVARLGHA